MRVIMNFYTPQTGWYVPLPALDSPQTLVLVFGDPDFQRYQTALTELQAHYRQAIIAGCSALSGIFNDRLVENALLIGIIQFEYTQLAITTAHLNNIEDSWRAGRHIATTLHTPDLKGILLLTDGLNTHSAELLAGIASVTYHQLMILGCD